MSKILDWLKSFTPKSAPQVGLVGLPFEINPKHDPDATQKRNIARLGRLVLASEGGHTVRIGEINADIVRHVSMITGGAVQLDANHIDSEAVRELLDTLQGSKE